MKFLFRQLHDLVDVQRNFEQLEAMFSTGSQGSLQATSPVTVTATTSGTAQAIPGLSWQSQVNGYVVVLGAYDFAGTATGWSAAVGQLTKNGVVQSGDAILLDSGAATQGATVAQHWMIPVALNDVLAFNAFKTVGAGTLAVQATHTTMNLFQIR